MSSWRFILKSLLFHWRINAAVALGVIAATAVLTGALLVGDSVRGSLRFLALDRLGEIDHVIIADRFFRAELADELSSTEGFDEDFESSTPAIIFPNGTIERRVDERTNRSGGILVVGCDSEFWKLSGGVLKPKPFAQSDEIILNEPLATDLGVTQADVASDEGVYVTLRLPKQHRVSADHPLGEKEDLVSSLPRMKVIDIVPAKSLGRFSLYASQSLPRNAYVPLKNLQNALQQAGTVNTILVAGKTRYGSTRSIASNRLAALLKPKFEDYGLQLKRARLTYPDGDGNEQVIFDYFSLSTDKMVFDDEAARAAENALTADNVQPVFTYLANEISKRGPNDEPKGTGIPYSTISAIDFLPQFQPTSAVHADEETGKPLPIEELDDTQIVLNRWAAEDLNAQIGDTIRVTYFEPETSHGEAVEQYKTFQLVDIAAFTAKVDPDGPGRQQPEFQQRPTVVNDPDLTPEVPGITDQQSIEDWELPFRLTRTIRRKDDEYWNEHRLTPKAFISLSAGQSLWGSRFGHVTSFRIPARDGMEPGSDQEREFITRVQDKLLNQIRRDKATLGFEVLPLRAKALTASQGTTPFDVLFLALSFFIIAAALMLVALLFRLGVEQRAGEVGLLLAVGLRRRLTGWMLGVEGTLVAAIGSLLGVVVGVGYAWLMLTGLKTIWLGAIVTPFLELYVTPLSLILGYGMGVLISALTIIWTIFRTRSIPVRRLLAGQASAVSSLVRRQNRLVYVAIVVMFVGALICGAAATRLGGEAQAGAFVGAGMLMLGALLAVIWFYLRRGGGGTAVASGLALAKLAARNAGRNPWRSTITIGLVATASFLIVAMSSFRLQPTETGIGGFDFYAESSQPVVADLNTAAGRAELLGDRADVLSDGTVLSLRLKPGDDASCNNLYKSIQPRVLGVTPQMIEYFDNDAMPKFSFAAHAGTSAAEKKNPWHVLDEESHKDGEPIPVIIDKNTAMYSLQLYWGIGEEFEIQYEDGTTVKFRVAGLLANSILQGSLLVSEADFKRVYPEISGYRYFLIRTPKSKDGESALAIMNVLEDQLGDQGFDVGSSRKLLENFLAVQNTYLSTFQSLGALGLLLGTFGLAAVQLRSVLERRQELALMRAAGFRKFRLVEMVMLENAVLLLGGLFTGIIAALLAVLPHMIFGNASVPFVQLAVMLVVVLAVGLLSGLAAVRATLKAPLLAAMRGD